MDDRRGPVPRSARHSAVLLDRPQELRGDSSNAAESFRRRRAGRLLTVTDDFVPGEVAEVRATDGTPLLYRVWAPPDPHAARATMVFFNGVMSHSLWFAPL